MQSLARGRKVPKVPPKIKGRGGGKGNFGGALKRLCSVHPGGGGRFLQLSRKRKGNRRSDLMTALLAATPLLPVCFLGFWFFLRSPHKPRRLFRAKAEGFWGQTAPIAEEENISERSLAEKASDTSLPVHSGSVEETPQTPTSVSHLFFPFCRSEGSGGVNPLIGSHLPAALTALTPNIRGAASRALASLNHPAVLSICRCDNTVRLIGLQT